MGKKLVILSLVFCIAAVWTTIPGMAGGCGGFTDVGSFDQLKTALEAGESVRLTCDITETDTPSCLHVGSDTAIDLNGHSLRVLGSCGCSADGGMAAHLIRVCGGATLTICDSSSERSGSLTGGCASNSQLRVVEVISGALVLEGGTVTNERDVCGGSCTVYLHSGSRLELRGGAVRTVTSGSGKDCSIYLGGDGAQAVISSGQVTGGSITNSYARGKLTVTGGTVEGDLRLLEAVLEDSYAVFDGVLSRVGEAPPEQFSSALVRDGSHYYYTCPGVTDALISGFKDGDVIITGEGSDEEKIVGQNVRLTVKCVNGAEVTGLKPASSCVLKATENADGSVTYESVVTAETAAAAAITAGGELTYCSQLSSAAAAAGDGGTVKLLRDSVITGTMGVSFNITLDLNGFTITGASAPSVGYGVIYVMSGDTLTVVDSSVGRTGGIVNSGGGYELVTRSNAGSAVIVRGGNFSGDFCAATGSITVLGGRFASDVSAFVPGGMRYDPDTGEVVVDEQTAAAVTGGVGYTSLGEAVAAAEPGGTVAVFAGEHGESFTIDKPLTLAGAKTAENARSLSMESVISAPILIENGADVVFDGLKFTGEGGISSGCGSLTLRNCSAEGLSGPLVTAEGGGAATAGVISLTGNVVSGMEDGDSSAFELGPAEGYEICGNRVENTAGGAFSIASPGGGILFSGNSVSGAGGSGLCVTGLGSDCGTICVTGNSFNAVSGCAVRLTGGGGCVVGGIDISGNSITESGAAIALENMNITGGFSARDNTADGEPVGAAASGTNAVTAEAADRGELLCAISGSAPLSFTLPDAPSRHGYIFLGWRGGGVTCEAGETVDITTDTAFTAVWGSIPDVSEPESPFNDVSVSDWFCDAAAYVHEKGLMDGVDTGVFDPHGTLTRAMAWTTIARAEGVETTGGAVWFDRAQEYVMANGISDGEDPNAPITREQLVTMLYRLAGEPAVSGTVTAPDASCVSSWAADAMVWAMDLGLVEGDENGAVTPAATATRAQAAALIMRYLEA